MTHRPRAYVLRDMMLNEYADYQKAKAADPVASLGGVSEHMFAREYDTGLDIIVTVASTRGQQGGNKSYRAKSAMAAYAYLKGVPRARNLWYVGPAGTRTKIHY